MKDKNIYFKKLKNALIKLYGKIELIEELQKHRGDKFNIFSILKMERLEVNTHSAFLYEFINPKGTHYQEDKYLRIFIDKVLKIENFDFENVKVNRETFTNTSRRIDFTIENKDYYIAIEMKIDATDQDNQLSDYYEYAKKQNKEYTEVYYLTLDGKDASGKSSKGNKLNYEKISFQFDILNFIEKSIEKSANLPIIRESLIQYKNLILNITNQTTQEIQMEIIEIIDTPKMAEAATKMSKDLAKVWAKREVLFWKYLAIRLEKYLKDKENWKLIQSICLNGDDNLLEIDNEIVSESIEKYKRDYVRGLYLQRNDFCFYIYSYNSGVLEYRIEKEEKVEEFGKLIGINTPIKVMPNQRYVTTKYDYNFSKDFHKPTYNIFDNEKLDEIVENIFDEIKSYMDIIVKELK